MPANPNPEKECDLVMKGGIASGVVYPSAIIALAEKYRFRSIGGTSAGAIAAAATAAAEYGRTPSTPGEPNGFDKLEQMSRTLGEAGFLRGLFQPAAATRPLMEFASALLKRRRRFPGLLGVARSLWIFTLASLRFTFLSFAIGGVFGYGLCRLFVWLVGGSIVGRGMIPCVFSFWLFGLFGAVARLGGILWRTLPNHFYGICTGHQPDPQGKPALTDWLSAYLDDMAGKKSAPEPLTFGDLKAKGIELRMVTSNLSQRQPYVLPFQKNRFLFNEDEIRALFPEKVADHLIHKAYQSARVPLPPGYHFLPDEADLPVVFAMRLSLSFPALVCAVPLYSIKASAFQRPPGTPLTQADLLPNWFSDGGIASNFPIHFFDSWLPGRPTFGIDLTSFPEEAFETPNRLKAEARSVSVKEAVDAAPNTASAAALGLTPQTGPEAVELPKANRPMAVEWHGVKGLFDFLGAIFSTAQNYRDTMQSQLPSYRERIVQVRLSAGEGGMNLDMPPETIQAIVAKGKQAGEMLRDQFQMEPHQWVRFLVLMAQLEKEIHAMQEVLNAHGFDAGKLMQDQRAKNPDGTSVFPYPRDQKDWLAKAEADMQQLNTLLKGWQDVFVKDCPQPEPVLRVTPRV